MSTFESAKPSGTEKRRLKGLVTAAKASDVQLSTRFRHVARVLSLAALAIALAVLGGYGWDVPGLVTLRAGFQGMAPLTAFGLIALSAASLSSGRKPALVWGFSSVALAIAASLLASHFCVGGDALNQTVARLLFPRYSSPTGLTSLATALCLALLACAHMMRQTGKDNLSQVTAASAMWSPGWDRSATPMAGRICTRFTRSRRWRFTLRCRCCSFQFPCC